MHYRFSLTIWLIALVALLPASALAATFLQKDKQELFISSPIDDDVYAAAQKITVTEPINQDAALFGQIIEVQSTIEQDLYAAGQDIRLLGTVNDDAHLAGSKVRIVGDVAGDLFAAGEEIELMNGSTVGEDVYVAGSIIRINGTVTGTVRAAGDTIIIGENAVIEGDLISYGNQPTLEEGASVLGSQEHRVRQDFTSRQRNPLSDWVRATLALLLVVLLITWLMPHTAQAVLDRIQEAPAKNILTGAVWLVLFIPATIILAVTLIGFPIALIIFAVTIVTYIVAAGLAALFIGRWVYGKLSPDAAAKQPLSWIPAVLGAALYEGIQMLGFLGGLATFILVLFVFGAIIQTLWRSRA